MIISPTFKQVIYSTACLTSFITMGMLYGFPTVLLTSITDANAKNDLYADDHTASWIASVPGLSGLITLVSLSPIMKLYGRRTAHICITTIILLGWIITSVANSIPLLFLGRLLHGLLTGACYFYSICLGELNNPHLRGIMLNLKVLAVSMGIGLVHLSGYFLHWKHVAIIVIIPVTISLLVGLFWPESPDWLVSRGRFEEARHVFRRLRGAGKGAEAEISKLIAAEMNKKNTKEKSFKKYCTKPFLRPVFLLMCSILVPEFGGRHFIPTYSIQLLTEFTSTSTNKYLYTFAFDILTIAGSFASVFIVKQFSRRRVLLSFGYVTVFLLVLTSTLMFVKQNYFSTSILSWLSLCLFGIYVFLSFTCTFSASYMLMGELLPLEFREIGSLVDGIISCIALALFSKLVPTMKNGIGIHGLFFVCAIMMLLALLYIDYDMPETKDRTLQDIGDYFRGKSPKLTTNNGTSNNSDESKYILE